MDNNLNPFRKLFETSLSPHSKTLRSTWAEKMKLLFKMLYGSFNKGSFKFGLMDYVFPFLRMSQFLCSQAYDMMLSNDYRPFVRSLKRFFGVIFALLTFLLIGVSIALRACLSLPFLILGSLITGIVHLVSKLATIKDRQIITEKLRPLYATDAEFERVKEDEEIQFYSKQMKNSCGLSFIPSNRFEFRKKLQEPYDKSMYVYVIPQDSNAMPELHYYCHRNKTFELVPLKEDGAANLKEKFKSKLENVENRALYSELSTQDEKSIQECVVKTPHVTTFYQCQYKKQFAAYNNPDGHLVLAGTRWTKVCDLDPNNLQDKAFFKALYRMNWGQFTAISKFSETPEKLQVAQNFLSH